MGYIVFFIRMEQDVGFRNVVTVNHLYTCSVDRKLNSFGIETNIDNFPSTIVNNNNKNLSHYTYIVILQLLTRSI